MVVVEELIPFILGSVAVNFILFLLVILTHKQFIEGLKILFFKFRGWGYVNKYYPDGTMERVFTNLKKMEVSYGKDDKVMLTKRPIMDRTSSMPIYHTMQGTTMDFNPTDTQTPTADAILMRQVARRAHQAGILEGRMNQDLLLIIIIIIGIVGIIATMYVAWKLGDLQTALDSVTAASNELIATLKATSIVVAK